VSSVAPIIPETLKNSRHVQYCCCSRLNQTPELILHVDFSRVNYALQMALRKSRCEIGDLGGYKTGPIHRSGQWESKICFTSPIKVAGDPSCINHIDCRVTNGTYSSIWGNLSVKKFKQEASESRGGSSLCPVRSPVIPVQTLCIGSMPLRCACN
jgi:hypothetical protein